MSLRYKDLFSQPNVAAYAASKGAVIAMTRTMAIDHAGDNIRANSICPGSIDTPLLRFAAEHARAEDPEERHQRMGRFTRLGKGGAARGNGASCPFPLQRRGIVHHRRCYRRGRRFDYSTLKAHPLMKGECSMSCKAREIVLGRSIVCNGDRK